ncbi:hypothetical protein [Natronorubrum tibetense]|uniref:LamG domain-containing protein n=1 Tax=Natronorubrum tibetense GA33 TaxID=1114856 RepID=L9VRV7_9EURY|nr:hypothetical protein [Natronorubrum tibetense]ELY39894.1 hypothetical protein C496_14491 [Natronorubrum tibetense GA33]
MTRTRFVRWNGDWLEIEPEVAGVLNGWVLEDWEDDSLGWGRRFDDVPYAFDEPEDSEAVTTARVGWDVLAGDPIVSNNSLTLPGDATSGIETPAPTTAGTWSFEFQFQTISDGTGAFTPNIIREDTDNRWRISVIENGGLELRYDEGGSTSTVVSSTWPVDTDPHTVSAVHDGDGNWELFFDGVSEGTETETFMPSNPEIFAPINTADHDLDVTRIEVF